ncbi:hypothetical protein EON67_02595 [archaeon]|nr:MAG: hypothetical protein EON67_02595 [archaeon]
MRKLQKKMRVYEEADAKAAAQLAKGEPPADDAPTAAERVARKAAVQAQLDALLSSQACADASK